MCSTLAHAHLTELVHIPRFQNDTHIFDSDFDRYTHNIHMHIRGSQCIFHNKEFSLHAWKKLTNIGMYPAPKKSLCVYPALVMLLLLFAMLRLVKGSPSSESSSPRKSITSEYWKLVSSAGTVYVCVCVCVYVCVCVCDTVCICVCVPQ